MDASPPCTANPLLREVVTTVKRDIHADISIRNFLNIRLNQLFLNNISTIIYQLPGFLSVLLKNDISASAAAVISARK